MSGPFSPAINASGLSALRAFISDRQSLPIARGIEKEGLRVTPSLDIAQSDHPEALGHPLTHPMITTDYSEALLELITPVEPDRESLMKDLSGVHHFVQHHIGDELLWAASMPCRLEGDASIRIAGYGNSNIGQLKHVYRQGLGVRYGRVMQSIAGLHYNFSLDDGFWETLRALEGTDSTVSLQDYKSERYFALIRNFRRHAWLLMYLFGASPVLDESFVAGRSHSLATFDDKGSLYKPDASSLRMGDLGYHNNAQASLAICFNTLQNFTQTLGNAIHTSYPAYEKIGIKQNGQFIQLNTNILQIENEYYSSIRPKRTTRSGEKPTEALIDRGVEYIEVRCLDLNPFMPYGISESQIDFLDTFLIHCLLTDSPFIPDSECRTIDDNFTRSVNEGRKPGLMLSGPDASIALQDWGKQLIDSMLPIAEALDSHNPDQRYAHALEYELEKLRDSERTPSAQILRLMHEQSDSWLSFAGNLSRAHKKASEDVDPAQMTDIEKMYQEVAKKSIDEAHEIERQDTEPFASFLSNYLR